MATFSDVLLMPGHRVTAPSRGARTIITTIEKNDVVVYAAVTGLQDRREAARITLASAGRLHGLGGSALGRTERHLGREAARDGPLEYESTQGDVTITSSEHVPSTTEAGSAEQSLAASGGGGDDPDRHRPPRSSHAEDDSVQDVEEIFTDIQRRARAATRRKNQKQGSYQFAGLRIYTSAGQYDVGFVSFKERHPTKPEHTETYLLRMLCEAEQKLQATRQLYLYSTYSPCFDSKEKCLDQIVAFAERHPRIHLRVAFNIPYLTNQERIRRYLRRIGWPNNLQVYQVSVHEGEIVSGSLRELPRDDEANAEDDHQNERRDKDPEDDRDTDQGANSSTRHKASDSGTTQQERHGDEEAERRDHGQTQGSTGDTGIQEALGRVAQSIGRALPLVAATGVVGLLAAAALRVQEDHGRHDPRGFQFFDICTPSRSDDSGNETGALM